MKPKFLAIKVTTLLMLFFSQTKAQNKPVISKVPKKIYQSFTSTPDDFIKICLANEKNILYGIGTKGKYIFDLLNKSEKYYNNKPFVSRGYIDYRDLSTSKNINPTPYLNSEIVSDSSISLSINPIGEPFYLDNLDINYQKNFGINSWFITSVKKKTILNEPLSKYLYNFDTYGYGASQWLQVRNPNTGNLSYILRPSIFNFTA